MQYYNGYMFSTSHISATDEYCFKCTGRDQGTHLLRYFNLGRNVTGTQSKIGRGVWPLMGPVTLAWIWKVWISKERCVFLELQG